jgi:GNAT superfamily N-acetyltransferase
MSTTLLIRDGLSTDLPACLELDHRYATEFVWQMRLAADSDPYHIAFQRERLPRALETEWPADEQRIRLALPSDQCFLVAENRDESTILGYVTMQSDHVYHIARLQDLVVGQPYRRNRIGTRLLNVARKWAVQQHLTRLTAEIQTQNYPAILFCQRSGLTFCGFNDHYFPNQDIAVFFSENLR